MKKFYYYAELNDNDVCKWIISSTEKMSGGRYIELHEYNETVRYRKWLGDQWSSKSYEPDVDTKIQDKLNELEESNSRLEQENLDLKLALVDLAETYETKITELQLALAEIVEGGITHD